MARIRSLKIGFFKNEHLAALSPWHRLLFEGLWLLADREGRLEDRPLRIKAELFPYDVLDVSPLLEELDAHGFIQRYTADGAGFIAVVKFCEHQRPKSDEAVSLIPAPLLRNPRCFGAGPGISPLGKDIGHRTGDIGQGERETAADVAAPPADGADGSPLQRATEFSDAWNRLTEPPIPRCRELSSARKRHIRIRLTERPLTEWEQVIERIQASGFCRGANDRGWVATFDWLIGSPDVAVKVLEGKYDDRTPTGRQQRPFTAAEVTEFENWRRAMGGCGHRGDRCETRQECMTKFIKHRRGEAA